MKRVMLSLLLPVLCLVWGDALRPQKAAPAAVSDNYATGLNTTLTVLAAEGVLANDTDANGTAGLTADPNPVTDVTSGTLTLASDGSFTYTPNPGYSGTDTFEYRVCDDGTPDIVVSRFDFDTPALDQATIGPNATSVSPLAAQTGCGIYIFTGAGGNTGIDVLVPNTGGIFNFTSFAADFEYRDQEGTADLATGGNFRIWHISGDNLGIQVRVIDGNTGLPATYTLNLGGFLAGSNPYRIEYDELTGDIIYTANGSATTFNLAPAYSPLNTALASPVILGQFMDNNGTSTPSLCSMQFTDTSKLCDTGLVTIDIPTSLLTNRRITYRVNRD